MSFFFLILIIQITFVNYQLFIYIREYEILIYIDNSDTCRNSTIMIKGTLLV